MATTLSYATQWLSIQDVVKFSLRVEVGGRKRMKNARTDEEKAYAKVKAIHA